MGTYKRWDGKTERRIEDRRKEWRENKCLFCEDIQDATKEHRALVCSKIKTVESNAKKDLAEMKRIFGFCVLVALGFAGWIAIDHIGLSRLVAGNTKIIEVMYDNQSVMMHSMGLQPKALPEKAK